MSAGVIVSIAVGSAFQISVCFSFRRIVLHPRIGVVIVLSALLKDAVSC